MTEFEFMLMAGDPSTVILDARSAEKFALLHVKGAKNLSLPDITEEELAKVIPSKSTRILIYCNNNFLNEPSAFPAKNLSASLNVYTMNVLLRVRLHERVRARAADRHPQDHHSVRTHAGCGLGHAVSWATARRTQGASK